VHRGFDIRISGLAVAELSVRLQEQAPNDERAREQQAIRSRVRFLATLLGDITFAPTHDHLVEKLGGYRRGAGNITSWSDWLSDTRMLWREIANDESLSQKAVDLMDSAASYIEDTGSDFVESADTAARFGRDERSRVPPELEELIEQIADEIVGPDLVDTIELPVPSARERFDAHFRLSAFYMRGRLGTRERPRAALEANHATDLNLLQHLAEPLVLVTSDYAFIEDVDRCGTVQAPWVRTIGDLLAGKIPIGLPFGLNAQKQAASHRQRDRSNLKRLDEEGLLRAKAEEGRRSGSI
jgi:hypothetical protein